MKKLIVALTIIAATAASYAQGTVSFLNNNSTLITVQGGGSAAVGSLTVGLYYSATANDNNIADFSLIATTGIAPVPGRYSDSTTVVTPNTTAPGAQASFIVRAWTAGYASYDAAVTAYNGGASTVLVGQSQFFTLTTGGAGSPPSAATPTTANGFAVATPAPEPSTIALGALGGLSLLFVRRRK